MAFVLTPSVTSLVGAVFLIGPCRTAPDYSVNFHMERKVQVMALSLSLSF